MEETLFLRFFNTVYGAAKSRVLVLDRVRLKIVFFIWRRHQNLAPKRLNPEVSVTLYMLEIIAFKMVQLFNPQINMSAKEIVPKIFFFP